MSVKVEKISDSLKLGEGPHWDEKQQALFFVDINGAAIHKYVPTTGEHTFGKLDGRVGFAVPIEGTTDQFIVGVEKTFQVVQWDGKNDSKVNVVKVLGKVDQDVDAPTRINDGKADPRGRIFAGTMGNEVAGEIVANLGSFYRIDNSGAIVKLCDKISISNGLAWDLKENAMYYTDSFDYNIRRYDYNVETGEISNMRYIFDFKKNGIEGLPDGTTIDKDGNLWVAVFFGSCVIQIDPRTGKLLKKIPIPAEQVTSVIFGGPNYDILFVTSACVNIDNKQKPAAGCTYMVTGLGVTGLPGYNFKLQA
ncbi:unnamed protein product [Colias eurytheme]|nr:unnamed protein product [Colias eurytheme]